MQNPPDLMTHYPQKNTMDTAEQGERVDCRRAGESEERR